MSLVIIAPQQVERRSLKEAFEYVPIPVKAYDSFDAVEKLADDDFILAVMTRGNILEIKKYADQHSVFLIADEACDDGAGFDDVFIRPVRLGHVVNVVHQAIKQQEIYKEFSPIQLGSTILNPKASHLDYKDKSVRLTEKELAVLIFLSKNIGGSVPRQKLLDEVWGYAEGVETHTLETHIYRLRQKLQSQLGLDHFLVTNDDGYFLKV